VAFIDDDALPDFSWLAQAIPSFSSEDVAAVGGIVFDHTGMALQYRYSAANRFAEPEWRFDRPYDSFCFPGSFQFPYVQGTNALFRRSALLRVGGFDETYDYYLDETDLCCRLVDAGYVLRQLPDAAVHHKLLPSSVRNHQRVVTNWFSVTKNQTYFSYRHAYGSFTGMDILDHVLASIHTRIEDARGHELAGRLPAGSADRAAAQCAEALQVGTALGLERHELPLGPVDWPVADFASFPTIDSTKRRRVTFLSNGYAGGVAGEFARYVNDLAPAVARRGHEVRVVTRAAEHSAVDLEGAVWVHRVQSDVDDFAAAGLRELARIGTWTSHDVVYGPLQDNVMLEAVRGTDLPTILRAGPELEGTNRPAQGESVLQECDLVHTDPLGSASIDQFAERFERLLDRIHLRDVTRAIGGPASVFEPVRAPSGYIGAMLRTGDRITMPTEAGTSARVCVAATHVSTIVIDSGTEATTHRVAPGDVRRFAVDTSQPTVELRLIHGRALVSGLVTVAPEDSGRRLG